MYCGYESKDECEWDLANVIDKLPDGRWCLTGNYGSHVDGVFYIVYDLKITEICEKAKLDAPQFAVPFCNKCTDDVIVPLSKLLGQNPCLFFDPNTNIRYLLQQEAINKEAKLATSEFDDNAQNL